MIAEDYQENYLSGYIKSYRSTMKKGWYKKSEYFHLWHHLLYKASHKGYEFIFNGENIYLNPGQFISGRKALSNETGINESKIERILSFFEKNEHQIEQQKTNKNRLITVINYDLYQNKKLSEQQFEQQVNNKRTTSEQQVNTYKNDNNEKNNNKEIVSYLNLKTNKTFKDNSKKTNSLINARFKEGFIVEDFKKVIDVKTSKWKGDPKMEQYLRPETLFGTKFESYLNEELEKEKIFNPSL